MVPNINGPLILLVTALMTLWASRSGTLLDDDGDAKITAATKLTAVSYTHLTLPTTPYV